MFNAGAMLCLVQLLVWRANAQADTNFTYAPSNLTQEEQDLFLNVHNELRAKVDPEAANMMHMEWDDSLAAMAQAWSETCHWDHGQPSPNVSPFDSIGQNLFLIYPGYDSRPSGLAVVTSWYNEIAHYTIETGACLSGKICGHYTQLAWATSYAIGCAMAFCESATGTDATDLWLVTCNYGPVGNIAGKKPYIPGKNCTKCGSGIGECYNSLCRPCSDHSEECVCAQTCANCGVLNSTSCTCECPNGFTGTDCSDICEDFNVYCGNGYPVPWCWDENQDFMFATCPATCGLCIIEQDPDFECDELIPTMEPEPTLEPGTLPTSCVQLECQNGGRFDEEACTCRCTALYQGALCQHNREEAASGVLISFVADINLWETMAPTLRKIVADALTSFCNDNFEMCCPNKGPNTLSEKLAYANESNILVADGYPEPKVDAEGAFSTMFLAAGLEEAELCVQGGTPLVRRRRGVAIGDMTHEVHIRAANSGIYLDQGILLQVIQESTANMTQGLADIGITVTVSEVEAGQVEPPDVVTAVPPAKTALPPTQPAPFPGLSASAIAGIVIGAILVLAACVGAVVCGVLKISHASTTIKPFTADQKNIGSYGERDFPTKTTMKTPQFVISDTAA